jgi:site-specific recombinase XerD
VLTALPRLANNPFALPGERKGAQFAGIQKAWQRIRHIAGLDDLRIHDLRHGFASVAVQSDESLYLVGRLLGHRQIGTTERYAHLAATPLQAVADRTAERLLQMMHGHDRR